MIYYLSIVKTDSSNTNVNILFSNFISINIEKQAYTQKIQDILIHEKGDWFSLKISSNDVYTDYSIYLIDNVLNCNHKSIVDKIISDCTTSSNLENEVAESKYSEAVPLFIDNGEFNFISDDENKKIPKVFLRNIIELTSVSGSFESGASGILSNIIYGVLGNATYDFIKTNITKIFNKDSKVVLGNITYKEIIEISSKYSGIPKKLHILVSTDINEDYYVYNFRAKGKNILLKISNTKKIIAYIVSD